MAEEKKTTAAQPAGEDQKLAFVKSKLPQREDGGNEFILHEKDPRHPTNKGELYIADDRIHKVAMTSGVAAAIADGRLEEVTSAEYNAEQKRIKEAAEEARNAR